MYRFIILHTERGGAEASGIWVSLKTEVFYVFLHINIFNLIPLRAITNIRNMATHKNIGTFRRSFLFIKNMCFSIGKGKNKISILTPHKTIFRMLHRIAIAVTIWRRFQFDVVMHHCFTGIDAYQNRGFDHGKKLPDRLRKQYDSMHSDTETADHFCSELDIAARYGVIFIDIPTVHQTGRFRFFRQLDPFPCPTYVPI